MAMAVLQMMTGPMRTRTIPTGTPPTRTVQTETIRAEKTVRRTTMGTVVETTETGAKTLARKVTKTRASDFRRQPTNP
jgi:hypothetical protein